jgi:hypothetical protein
MGMEAAADVRFDYVGSLQLARRLWALADDVDAVRNKRVALGGAALTDWLGAYGTQFADRINLENVQAATIANEMRTAAEQWAVRWAEAMNEQNHINLAREIKHIEDDRSGWDNFTGFFGGHDDLPSAPGAIPVPTAPSFTATGTLTRY